MDQNISSNIGLNVKKYINQQCNRSITPWVAQQSSTNIKYKQRKRFLVDWRKLYDSYINSKKIVKSNLSESQRISKTAPQNINQKAMFSDSFKNIDLGKSRKIASNLSNKRYSCKKTAQQRNFVDLNCLQHLYARDLLKEVRVESAKQRKYYSSKKTKQHEKYVSISKYLIINKNVQNAQNEKNLTNIQKNEQKINIFRQIKGHRKHGGRNIVPDRSFKVQQYNKVKIVNQNLLNNDRFLINNYK